MIPIEIDVDPTPVTIRAGGALTPNPDILVLPGPAGPAGPPGAGLGYDHTQGSASATWIITHNLGYYPSVTVNIGGEIGLVDVAYGSVNVLTITFASPQTGSAHLI